MTLWGRGPNKVPYGRHYERSDRKSPKQGGPKPPKKGGGLCVQVAPFAAWPALIALAHAIGQSFIS